MKTKLIATGLAAFICAIGLSQPYGQTKIPNSSVLNGGGLTGLNAGNEGFITIGMKGYWIHIDKTKIGGTIPSPLGPTSFQRKYEPKSIGACTGGTYDVINCTGANVIEIVNNPNGVYAMVGSYDKACFLAFLGPDGVPTTVLAYPFPVQQNDTVALRAPVIARAQSGKFYIAGQFLSQMYAMEVDQNGNVLWSHFYDINGTIFQPRAIIESPFTSEVVIAGWMTPDPIYSRTSDGFFMSLNPANGNVNVLKDYSGYVAGCDWFDAIKISHVPITGDGYVISGYSDVSPHCNALVMKLDLGGNIIWNHVIENGSNNTSIVSQDAMDVIERINTAGQYEYYTLAQSWDPISVPGVTLNDMTIFKLDELGNAYHTSHTGVKDEFHYPATVGSEYFPWNLTSLPVSSTHDVGLQMHVNHSSNHMIWETYFNGFSNCGQQLAQIHGLHPGPTDINVASTTTGTLSACAFGMTQLVDAAAPSYPCQSATVVGGNNAREMEATGIAEQSDPASLSLYPNPGSGIYTLELPTVGQIEIYNSLGALIYSDELESGQNEINLLKQANGIYIARISGNGFHQNFQLIKN